MERKIHDIGEHILVFEGFFSDIFCDTSIEEFELMDKAGLTYGRDQDTLGIKDTAVGIRELTGSTLPHVQELTHIINNEILEEFYKKYPIRDNYEKIALDGAKLQRTQPTEGYHQWHMEHCNEVNSKQTLLAWGLFLNDVEEGGELEFLYQSKRVKPKKGDFVLWPGGFTHMHRGNPPLQGIKYIYTGWISYI